LDDFGLVKGLERDDVLGFGLGSDHVHSSKLAFAEWASHVEVMESPFPGWMFPII
jgi:hypothetical protein